MNNIKIFILAGLLVAIGGLVTFAVKNKEPSRLELGATSQAPQKTIKIGGATLKINIAKTNKELAQGLGGVTKMPEDEGMLFILPKQNVQTPFWMKEMLIPIDIIWINDGKVVQVDENIPAPSEGTLDQNLKLYISSDPVDYVLEVNAGFSSVNNIKKGTPVDLSGI